MAQGETVYRSNGSNRNDATSTNLMEPYDVNEGKNTVHFLTFLLVIALL